MADPMQKAEKAFKKEEQRREGVKNMAEYEATQLAEQKKTERLRALRLARDAEEAAAEAAAPPAKPKPRAKKKAATKTAQAERSAQ